MLHRTDGAPVLTRTQLSDFCYQLSLLLQSGVSHEEGVGLLCQEAQGTPVHGALERLHALLAEGAPLDRALAETGAFPAHLVRMVEIGQVSGRLEEVFSALSGYYRREEELWQSMRRTVVYPAAMSLLVGAVFLVLVSRVLPVFEQLLGQLGVGLGSVAYTLLRLGSAGRGAAAVFLALLAAVSLFLFWAFRSGGGGALRLLSKTAAGRAADRSRFASAMALMMSSGLPLDEAMEHTCRMLEDSPLSPGLADCRRRMEAGTPFPQAVEEAGLASRLQAGLLSVGTRAGAADQAMGELARRCQEEADAALERMMGRFEYAVLIVLSLAVGLVLLSVMLPLLGVLSAIGG